MLITQALLLFAAQGSLADALQPTPIDNPVLAASPNRELFRSWDQCLSEKKLVLGLASGNVDLIMQQAFRMCEDQESRLTGTLVRRYGYKRGSSIIAETKGKIVAYFKNRLRVATGVDDPNRIGQWVLDKLPTGCEIRATDEDRTTVLGLIGRKFFLAFRFNESGSSIYKPMVGRKIPYTIKIHKDEISSIETDALEMQLTFKDDDIILFSWVDPSFFQKLLDQEVAILKTSVKSAPWGQQRTYGRVVFPLQGIRQAHDWLKRCPLRG